MTPDARARLALSLVTEPGHPHVRDRLASLTADRLVEVFDRDGDADRRVDRALERSGAAGLRWIVPGDAEWPLRLTDLDHVEPLQQTAGAPLGLWVRGAARLDELSRDAVSVVGARSCTTYGAEVAGGLAADVADAGFTIVSGAAFGIDACAHRGALSLGRPTIAVLACGADTAYPVAHATLLDRIAAEGGLVVSEQAPGASPQRHRFLTRNRIIAALSRGTVVVEAEARSGSLNTLHWADLLARTTMAVPGPVTSRRSDGVHAAVRGGKAVLVTSGADVVEELTGLRPDQVA